MTRRAESLAFALLLSAVFAAVPARAQIFGPSDEEIAREKAQDDQLAKLSAQAAQDRSQIQDLEDKVQSLTQSLAQATGANEELSHQLSLMSQKLDRAQKDFAYRLCMLSAQQLGASSDDQGLNCAAEGSAGGPAATPAAGAPTRLAPGSSLAPLGPDNGSNVGPGRPPGTLGTLSSGPSPTLAPAPAAAGNTGQFDAAMNLLARAQYAEASAAFRAYADAHPDDEDLSSQAIYWVGDIAYVQHDYQGAARAFAEELKKYPDAGRSPDAMLKLGQALVAEGQTSGGCTTFTLLKKKYPNASQSTLAAAEGARKSACK